MPRDFVLQMAIGPLYEEWKLDPDRLNREFERAGDKKSYRAGWRVYDPYIGREITNPFRVKMYKNDTFFLGVASWDDSLNITQCEVTFIPRPEAKAPTPFGDQNPWGELKVAEKASNPGRGYALWEWKDHEREAVVYEGAWDIVATVKVDHSSGHYSFGFDPRMCVGGGC